MITSVNNEDRLVQATFADHLRDSLGWDSVYAYDSETFGENGTLGRATQREIVLTRDLRSAIVNLNPDLPAAAVDKAVEAFNNLSDYADTIPHTFYHNGFLVVSNGDKARYGSLTSKWEHFAEWKRQDERDTGSVDARVTLAVHRR